MSMAPRITAEFCKNNILLFFPKTEAEAACIQQKLFALGITWENGQKTTNHLGLCAGLGMVVSNNKLYFSPIDRFLKAGIVCTVDQFNPLTPDQSQIMAMFTELAAKVDALQAEIMPKKMGNKLPRNPDHGS